MKPFLAIDAGAANLKVALFDPQSNGTLTLARYEVVSLGQRGLDEPERTELLKETLQELLDRHAAREELEHLDVLDAVRGVALLVLLALELLDEREPRCPRSQRAHTG